MANTILKRTLVDGPRNLVVHLLLQSDGSEETDYLLIDASTYTPAFEDEAVMKVDYAITNTATANTPVVTLEWEASTDVIFLTLGANSGCYDFTDVGGISNNASTGKNGDILMTTTGFAANDTLAMTIYLKKK